MSRSPLTASAAATEPAPSRPDSASPRQRRSARIGGRDNWPSGRPRRPRRPWCHPATSRLRPRLRTAGCNLQHQQRHEPKPGLRLGEERREPIALQSCTPRARLHGGAARAPAGDARRHQQRAGQTWPLRVGDATWSASRPCLGRRPLREGYDPPHDARRASSGADPPSTLCITTLRVRRRERPAGRVVTATPVSSRIFKYENSMRKMQAVAPGMATHDAGASSASVRVAGHFQKYACLHPAVGRG